MPPFLEPNSKWLVFQEASNSGKSYIWFWVCGCQDSNWIDYGPELHLDVLRCLHQVKILHVGWQQVCWYQCYTSSFNPEQKVQHPGIPVREATATKIIDFHWIQSEYNLSDMQSKYWELIQISQWSKSCSSHVVSSLWSQGHQLKKTQAIQIIGLPTPYSRFRPSMQHLIIHITY